LPGSWKEAAPWHKSNEHKESKILGETFPNRRQRLLVNDGSHNEEDSEEEGGRMKAEKAIDFFRFHPVIRHVVGCKPIFVQPEIK